VVAVGLLDDYDHGAVRRGGVRRWSDAFFPPPRHATAQRKPPPNCMVFAL
jgi:hypothetical protein